ncbi:hypothetical protein, conserved [Entamoeba dispar SAW760]|uniref:Septin-type G domain-containing protein n=1 Tax=Entamoeba dispar (strain ATCC PRA-260 / SAW760) TaxID=370354 RepID=B0ESP8_ENTDS|nr:uncharacterized protein EDI_343470 [Entamoeba dispar SAW760]EDR22426.1 hypothetical protein, conserved [Entamoeba dispar SAW760]|eukprot:EDR22426.1 hypothetical protein, conserved [Entamoeba dispar SAW760]
MSKVVVKFYLNKQCISTKPMNSQDNLKTAREKLGEKISDSQQFLSEEGDLIDINEEDSFTIGDIINESRRINIKETGDKKRIKLKLNDEVISTIEINKKRKLSDIRKSNQNIPESAHFYTPENDVIEKDDEETFSVEDIINNDEIILKNENENTSEMDIISVRIYLNGESFMKKQLNKNSSLSDIRKKLEIVTSMTKGFQFEDQKGFKIERDKEQSLKLSSILVENRVNITTKVVSQTSRRNTIAFSTSPKQRYSTSLNTPTVPIGSPNNTVIPRGSRSNTTTRNTSVNNTTPVSEKNIPIKGSIRLKNHETGKLKIYLYPNEPFNPKDESDAIAILVVGQTGSGKTTLLNSFINALYGIEITDDFRYIIINEDNLEQNRDQSKSQTSEVSIYNIKRTKKAPPIKIIDTPGFGDTRGIEYDKEITKQIKKAFETKVLDLNAICFVAQSSNVRLTASQKYIFDNIINLFGNDVKNNFIAMLTFCDGKSPQVIGALQSDECVFSTIIPEIDEPWYLKFNNSAIYDDDIKDGFTQMFWQLGMKSFDEFIEKLIKLPRKSLKQSREVLMRREQIKTEIEGIRISLNNSLLKMNEIEQIYKKISFYSDKINENKNYTFPVDVTIQKTVELKGEYATNCKKCHQTCHYPCHYLSLVSKFTMKYCHCIENGYCNVCGCHHSEHANFKYKYEYVTETRQQTAQDIYQRYNEGKEGMASAENMLKKLEEEYLEIQMDCRDKQKRIVECVNRLSEIALNGKVNSSNEYLDLLIESESEEKKNGYQKRIAGYKQLKQANEMIEDVMKKEELKKSKEEIKAEFEQRKNELKQGEKSTLEIVLQKLRNMLPWHK